MEPMFNFRSLVAMIGNEEKADGASHIEHHDSSAKANALEAEEYGAGAGFPPLSENSHQRGHHIVQTREEEMQGPRRKPLGDDRDATDA
jgi:hypothetical protein